MVPWATILGLAGTAASGILSAINNRRTERSSDAEAARQQAYYEGKAAENPLSRSDNQAYLSQYDRDAQRQLETARNLGAIKGASSEYVAAAQKGIAEGRANLMSNLAAGDAARKDRYEAMGEQARRAKYQEDQARRAARNETYAALAANAANAFGSLLEGAGEKNAPALHEAQHPNIEPPVAHGATLPPGSSEEKNNTAGAVYIHPADR